MLPRQPGTKEVRYAHLLSGEPDVSTLAPPERVSERSADPDAKTRIAALEQQVSVLQQQVDTLTRRLEELLIQLG